MVTSKYKTKRNVTKKNKLQICPIGLKPFEESFSKTASKTHLKKKREFIQELLSKFAPNSIKPEDDFYDYINYQWLKNVTLENQQKYLVQIDDFRLAQDHVYQQLHEIIQEYIRTHKNKLSKNLQNYYTSVIRMNSKSYSRQLAKKVVERIEDVIIEKNPWKLLAYYNKSEWYSNFAPFSWSLNPDDKHTKVYRSYLYGHTFFMLDLSVYYDDGKDVAYKKRYREEFNQYVKKIFDTVLGDNSLDPQDVFDVEVEMFNAFDCREITKQEKSYNKVYAEESMTKYGFDWKTFSKELGFKTPPPFFITSNLNYLTCMSKIYLQKWNSEKWKTYWIFIELRTLARFTREWEDITYDFFGKFERGQERKNVSNAVSSALYMTIPFNTFLTNEYVKKYENPQVLEYVKIMCHDLKEVFQRILKDNTWLSPSTKKYALKKLKHFQFIFGKPENLREDPDLDYTTVLYDNMKKINDWRMAKFIELEGNSPIDIPMVDWSEYPVKMVGTQAYIVNASYTPTQNAIYINLGYLQKPFVDLDERGIEYNLAHLGFTVGHEMSHGFDDWGSQYGWDGNLYDWWTLQDKTKYKRIQNDVIQQYEEFAKRDGIDFDASIGIGEDLADISGMAICDLYLKDFQEKNEDIVPIKYFSYQVFYTYFAFQQKQKVLKKSLAAQLKTNPHPLDKYRCNVPLSRSDIFRALYNVKKGDGMWWHNTNTVW
jgi:predicted metalloendopeptidase